MREGQQFRFGQVSASTLLPEIDLDRYSAEVQVETGDIFTPQAIDRTIERLELLATQEGRTFVRVSPRVTRNDTDLTLDVEFVIERGERLFVERIDIEGNATTLDRVIRRQFQTVEGDPFNPREIRAAAERIRALGYFATAEVNAREGTLARAGHRRRGRGGAAHGLPRLRSQLLGRARGRLRGHLRRDELPGPRPSLQPERRCRVGEHERSRYLRGTVLPQPRPGLLALGPFQRNRR